MYITGMSVHEAYTWLLYYILYVAVSSLNNKIAGVDRLRVVRNWWRVDEESCSAVERTYRVDRAVLSNIPTLARYNRVNAFRDQRLVDRTVSSMMSVWLMQM